MSFTEPIIQWFIFLFLNYGSEVLAPVLAVTRLQTTLDPVIVGLTLGLISRVFKLVLVELRWSKSLRLWQTIESLVCINSQVSV